MTSTNPPLPPGLPLLPDEDRYDHDPSILGGQPRENFYADLVQSALLQDVNLLIRQRIRRIGYALVALLLGEALVLEFWGADRIALPAVAILTALIAAAALFLLWEFTAHAPKVRIPETTPLRRAFDELLHALPAEHLPAIRALRPPLSTSGHGEEAQLNEFIADLSAFSAWSFGSPAGRSFWKTHLAGTPGKLWDRRFMAVCMRMRQHPGVGRALREAAETPQSPLTAMHLAINESSGLTAGSSAMPLLGELHLLAHGKDGRISHEGLLRLADDDSQVIRDLAVGHLAGRSDHAALDMILALLVENDRVEVRRAVSNLLIGRPSSHLLEVIAIALVDSDHVVRMNALRALTGLKENEEIYFLLEGALLDVEEVRSLVIGVLEGYKSQRAQNLLMHALGDSSPNVRAKAERVLRRRPVPPRRDPGSTPRQALGD